MDGFYKKSVGPEKVVIVSAFQDYRSKKRASIHQLAKAMAENAYEVSFISTRFSYLSKFNNDSREFLFKKANKVEIVDGVRCYLWRTAVHPFATRFALLNSMMAYAFKFYRLMSDTVVDGMLANADYIIFESGASVLLVDRARAMNPAARIIYYAADLLDTVGAHPFVAEQLLKSHSHISHVSVRADIMAASFPWAGSRIYRAPFGISSSDYEFNDPSPYKRPVNAVSVGSMLFDSRFFEQVAPKFPHVEFHVIGCGSDFSAGDNVRIYPEMPFRETLKYLKYATVGLAPYAQAPNVSYLADSSLKLKQYAYYGLPAVCPDFAVGSHPGRFGYKVGDREEMAAALTKALEVGGTEPQSFLSWHDVARRVIKPELFLPELIIS